MSEKKPNVFPTREQLEEANAVGTQLAFNQATGIPNATPEYIDPIAMQQPPAGEQAAAEEMRRRTQEQIALRNHAIQKTQENQDEGIRAREELMCEMNQTQIPPAQTTATPPTPSVTPIPAEQMAESAMSYEELAKFQKYLDGVEERRIKAEQMNKLNNSNVPPNTPPPNEPPSSVGQPSGMNPPPPSNDVFIQQLSQPQYDAAFDMIPLPSEGKLYKGGKKSIRVAYMTTADENILTSPNLLTSGKFLEILLNRKILEPELRYRDLVEGDRNAIMLWLRATGFGNMYPIQVPDEKGVPFETDIDLNEINTINLTTEPDENGLFTFKLPLCGLTVKFKILTVGEDEDIADRVEHEVDVLKIPVNNTDIYKLQKQIVSIEGSNNTPNDIVKFVENMRIGDSSALREYIETIDCGVDLSITVGTPGGGSINTFLPINLKFFWPNL